MSISFQFPGAAVYRHKCFYKKQEIFREVKKYIHHSESIVLYIALSNILAKDTETMTIKRKSSFSLETPCFLTLHFLLSSLSPYPMPPMANRTFPVPEDLSDAESVTKNTIYDKPGAETENNLPSKKTPAIIGQYRIQKIF